MEKNKIVSSASVSKNKILKFIKAGRADSLNECWEYHKSDLKDYGNITRKDLENGLYEIDLSGMEDVGFFIGYLRALDDFQELINKK